MTTSPASTSVYDEEPSITLGDLMAFNAKLEKLVKAGVPIRFAGAPCQLGVWLHEISSRVALRVGTGLQVPEALREIENSNTGYCEAFFAWCQSKQKMGEGSQGDLGVLETWVSQGLQGDKRLQQAKVSLLSLWLLAVLATFFLWLTVSVLNHQILRVYEQMRIEPGPGALWLNWIYENATGLLIGLTVGLLGISWIANRLLRGWVTHRLISRVTPKIWMAISLGLGGLLVLLQGLIVFWPLVELLYRVSEPGGM
jgi:hypothetical protein